MTTGVNWKRVEGLLCLGSVVVIWVTSSELIQHILDDLAFYKPFFLTFYNTSLFSVYLIGFLIFPSWRSSPSVARAESVTSGSERWESGEDGASSVLSPPDSCASSTTAVGQPFLSPREVARLSLFFAPWWFCANLAFNISLCVACGTGTSVASNTVISSCSLFFTLVLSFMFLGERVTFLKSACVMASIAGVALVSYSDAMQGGGDGGNLTSSVSNQSGVVNGSHQMLAGRPTSVQLSLKTQWPSMSQTKGDALTLLSAILFSVYSVLLKWLMPRHDQVNMPMFFGFLGLINTVLCQPILFALHVTGLEILEPMSGKVLLFLTINGLVGTVVSDLLWARAVVLTSPLTVNVGMGMTMPLSFLADYIHPSGNTAPMFHPQRIAGAGLVFCSFLAVVGAGDESSPETPASSAPGSPRSQPSINLVPPPPTPLPHHQMPPLSPTLSGFDVGPSIWGDEDMDQLAAGPGTGFAQRQRRSSTENHVDNGQFACGDFESKEPLLCSGL
mmetsp:Transcript_44300/g.118201  ORF Transcript_44300/g.118201 Transcript_44300/m.118201 type:complete len:503 (+) Transcript_44300:150-1658(+)